MAGDLLVVVGQSLPVNAKPPLAEPVWSVLSAGGAAAVV